MLSTDISTPASITSRLPASISLPGDFQLTLARHHHNEPGGSLYYVVPLARVPPGWSNDLSFVSDIQYTHKILTTLRRLGWDNPTVKFILASLLFDGAVKGIVFESAPGSYWLFFWPLDMVSRIVSPASIEELLSGKRPKLRIALPERQRRQVFKWPIHPP